MSLNHKQALRGVATHAARELRAKATPAETLLWSCLRANRLHGLSFYRQRPIYHDITGRETYFIADFYCHRARLIIEVDGEIHQQQGAEDQERTRILNHLGLRVIRFTNDEVLNNIQSILQAILQACMSHLALIAELDDDPM